MTPESCRIKRNEFNAMARQAEKAGNPALASWCRILSENHELMSSDDPTKRERGAKAYEKNIGRFEKFLAEQSKPS